MMSRSDDPDRRAQKAEQVEMQVKRITRLVDSLLLMTRLESNGTLANDQVDIAAGCRAQHTGVWFRAVHCSENHEAAWRQNCSG